ncbi:MAG: hypothetical protein HN919_14525 [Verrucomicrobia bacterium]|jgi:hypothetical protein|nr:hypothetical protein [Verrucomicrobiota bacterium]MBT7067514.1 hypothetical protein [Verrucomicrobiota bacterium]
MNGRELHQAIYSGEPFDRLPVIGLEGWTEAVERWRTEGLEEGVDPNEALGLISDDNTSLPLNLNMYPLFELEILEKDEQYVTVIDEFKVTKRVFKEDFDRTEGNMRQSGAMSSMSHWIDFPVKDMNSWKEIFEERFRATPEGRIPEDINVDGDKIKQRAETRWVSHFSFPFGGMFSAVRQLMGLEGAIFAMSDDPELVRTIVSDLGSFYAESFAMLLPEYRLDQIACFEDMCSNRAPLISPAMFREFFMPAYKEYLGRLKDMGVLQAFIDTDGDARRIIPELVECGFTAMWPCEIKAGMDPRELLEQYPTLSFVGGIDKVAVATGGEALEQECARRFKTAWDLGRYLPALDHLAPPDISWESAQRYARIVRACSSGPNGLSCG